MRKRSKRYQESSKKVDRLNVYSMKDGFALLKELIDGENTKVKFPQAIEIAFKLNIKAKHTIRDTTTLPNPIDATDKKILVFAKGDKAAEAEEAGATFVGDQDLVDKISDGWYDFDVAIATPDMMKEVGKLGKYLGRRGLMPNPKTGTVTMDIKQAVNEFKKGKVEYRADKTGVLHLKIGKSNMTEDQVMENVKTFYQEVLKKKPNDLKGEYIRSTSISGVMTPGIKISHQSILRDVS